MAVSEVGKMKRGVWASVARLLPHPSASFLRVFASLLNAGAVSFGCIWSLCSDVGSSMGIGNC